MVQITQGDYRGVVRTHVTVESVDRGKPREWGKEPSAVKLSAHRKPVNKRSLRKGGQNRGQRSGECEIRESKGMGEI